MPRADHATCFTQGISGAALVNIGASVVSNTRLYASSFSRCQISSPTSIPTSEVGKLVSVFIELREQLRLVNELLGIGVSA